MLKSDDARGRLARNAAFSYLVVLLKLLAPLVTLPYLTRVLSMETYGAIAFVKAYCVYVQLVVDFGFMQSATMRIVLLKGDRAGVGRVVGNTIVEKFLLTIPVIGATAVLSAFVPLLKGHAAFLWASVFACFATIAVLDFLYRGLERMEFVALPFAVSKILVTGATFVLVREDADYLLIPMLELLGNLVAGGFSIAFLKLLRLRATVGRIAELMRELRVSFEYFISHFATTFFGAFATLVVGLVLGPQDVAIWAICMMFVSATKAMYSPLGNTAFPRMVATRDLSLINRMARAGGLAVGALVLFVLALGDKFLGLVAGQAYQAGGDLLRWLTPVLVFGFYSMLYGWPVLGALGRVRETTRSTVAASVMQVGGVLLLVGTNALSLISLAICTGIAEGALLLIRLFYVWRFRSELAEPSPER